MFGAGRSEFEERARREIEAARENEGCMRLADRNGCRWSILLDDPSNVWFTLLVRGHLDELMPLVLESLAESQVRPFFHVLERGRRVDLEIAYVEYKYAESTLRYLPEDSGGRIELPDYEALEMAAHGDNGVERAVALDALQRRSEDYYENWSRYQLVRRYGRDLIFDAARDVLGPARGQPPRRPPAPTMKAGAGLLGRLGPDTVFAR